MILNLFHGFAMSIADSVPGVSGGTIAFILGFYDKFIDALHYFFEKGSGKRRRAFKYLANLGVGWGFGLLLSIFFLSNLFQEKIFLMSSIFLGLTLASIPFVIKDELEIIRENKKDFYYILIGIFVVIMLVLFRENKLIRDFDLNNPNIWELIYLFFSGAVAISAMVLPGISGSSILLIAGVYIPVVEALGEIIRFNFDKIFSIMILALGVIFGIFISINMIRDKMRHHRSKMLYLIIGMIIGSLYAIIMGPTTLNSFTEPLNISNFSFVGFLGGIMILFGLEVIKNLTMKKRV